ncbi:MAG: 4-oxalocrotonate tautomerase DmpI [bacterium]
MPIINMKGPELSKSQKQKLIQKFTQAASEVTEIPEEAFVVLLEEMKQDNVGVGGEMLSERGE